jgi:hypothetical protein
MGGVIIMLVLAYAVVFGLATGAIILSLPESVGLAFFNPIVLHRYWYVNWFGAYFLGIIFSVLLAPISIWYWLYKLCTFGR